jgi:hypothetical protein
MIGHIQKSCGLGAIESRMQTGYIKTNYTKHISPKKNYPHELQEGGDISILQIKSCNNLAKNFYKVFTSSHI